MNICLFGSASDNIDRRYIDDAFEMGRFIAESGSTLIFGGGNSGVMGASARGVSSLGGKMIGVSPEAFRNRGVLFDCEMRFTKDMSERKSVMTELSDAFLVLPGGIGTLDELFEIATLRGLGMTDKPLIVLNTTGFYDGVRSMLKMMYEGSFVGEPEKIMAFANTPKEAQEIILSWRSKQC